MSQPLPKHATAARFERSTVNMAEDRPILERSDLVLARAHVLHTNGQATHDTVQAAGAVLRRTLARYSANTLLQPLWAAFLAGMFGALAVRYNLSSSLRLVAVCPCMILVPGPCVLNGAMDLIALADYSNANFDLLRATIADAMTAIAIILAMGFGVVAPKMIIDRFGGGSTRTGVVNCQ